MEKHRSMEFIKTRLLLFSANSKANFSSQKNTSSLRMARFSSLLLSAQKKNKSGHKILTKKIRPNNRTRQSSQLFKLIKLTVKLTTRRNQRNMMPSKVSSKSLFSIALTHKKWKKSQSRHSFVLLATICAIAKIIPKTSKSWN